MSHRPVRLCPNCGTPVTQSGGLTLEEAGHGVHVSLHSMHHLGPISLLVGAGAAAMAALTPKSYSCRNCRTEFRR